MVKHKGDLLHKNVKNLQLIPKTLVRVDIGKGDLLHKTLKIFNKYQKSFSGLAKGQCKKFQINTKKISHKYQKKSPKNIKNLSQGGPRDGVQTNHSSS